MAINKRFASEEYVDNAVTANKLDMGQYFETINEIAGHNTLTWDGDESNKASIDGFLLDSSIPVGAIVVVKVSDEVPTLEELNTGATINLVTDAETKLEDSLAVENFFEYSEGTGVYLASPPDGGIAAPPIVVAIDNVDLGGLVVEKGVYLLRVDLNKIYGINGIMYVSSVTFNEVNERDALKESCIPSNIPATVIVEDSTHRFVTDNEKSTWNKKAGKIVGNGEIFNDYVNNTASGSYSHSEGNSTTASGIASHSEGNSTIASGSYSHAEGYKTAAFGIGSHAEGYSLDFMPSTITPRSTQDEIIAAWNTTGFTLAAGSYCHVEGRETLAFGWGSHAEGWRTLASGGNGSHAEGCHTLSSGGNGSHAEGSSTTASGGCSHAEGHQTTASGDCSHAEGWRTTAAGEYQHVQGRYNIEDTENKYAHIVGNGEEGRATGSNAHTLDWDGNAWFSGDVYVGGTSQTDASKLATEEYVKTKTTLTITQDATNTLASTADTQNWAEQTEYHPNQEMCFTRIFCTTSGDMTADTAYAIGTLADTSYAPGYTTPLNVMCGKQIQAYIGSTGTIYIKPYEATYGTIPVRLSGFWFK